MRLQRWLEDQLRDGKTSEAKRTLESLGFGAVAWHPDLYTAGDRARFEYALEQWAPPLKSTDGGDHIWMYRLDSTSPPTTKLPTVSQSHSHGIGTNVEQPVRGLFIELQVPFDPTRLEADEGALVQGWSQTTYEFEYRIDGQLQRGQLTNDGTKPGDWQDDYIWTGHIPGRLPPAMSLSLLSHAGSLPESLLWKGMVYLQQDNDRIAFQYRDGRVQPTNASADRPNPPAQRGAGIVAAMGWTGWISIVLLWLVRRRRELAVD